MSLLKYKSVLINWLIITFTLLLHIVGHLLYYVPISYHIYIIIELEYY